MRIIVISNGDGRKDVSEVYASKALQEFLLLYDGLFNRIYLERDPAPADGVPKHHIRYRGRNIPIKDYEAWKLKRDIDRALAHQNARMRNYFDRVDEDYFKEVGYPVLG